jgi:nucleoid DNA-binding protein
MQRAEIVKQMVKKTGIKTEDVEEILHAFFETVKENVDKGHHITLRGFGTFYPYHVPAKTAREMKPPYRPLHLKPRIKPAFKPSKIHFALKQQHDV